MKSTPFFVQQTLRMQVLERFYLVWVLYSLLCFKIKSPIYGFHDIQFYCLITFLFKKQWDSEIYPCINFLNNLLPCNHYFARVYLLTINQNTYKNTSRLNCKMIKLRLIQNIFDLKCFFTDNDTLKMFVYSASALMKCKQMPI